METNLQAWMQQYAARFRQPQTNLTASSSPMGQPPAQPPAQPMQPPAGAPGMGAPQTEAIPGDGFGGEGGDQSFQALFMSQPKEEQAKQIDELEKRVGSIDRAYDQMVKQMGQRPSTKLSRHEKGMLIMELGLQLMSQSGADKHGGDFGGAVGDAGLATLKSYQGLSGSKKQEAAAWDAGQSNLAAGRAKDVNATRSAFAKEQVDAQQADVSAGRLEETERHNREMEENAGNRLKNLEDWQNTQIEKGVGAGRPASGGAGGGKPTAAIQNIEYLVKNGMSRETATRIVHRQIKDPRKAYEEIYKSSRSRFANESDAAAEAKRITESLYGEGAIEKAQEPIADIKRSKSKSGRPIISKDGGKTWEFED